jgi:hypothetical protein
LFQNGMSIPQYSARGSKREILTEIVSY